MPAPPDVLIGRDLARIIGDEFTGRIKQVKFTYDVFVELENMPGDTQVWISPNQYSHVRESRSVWSESCTLFVVLIVEQAPNQNEQFIDAWLEDFRSLLKVIRESKPNGHPVLEINQDERYDRELFHQHARLAITAELLYNVIGD